MTERIWDSPKIHRIHVTLPDSPLQALNVYVVQGSRRTLIIDTGFNHPECHNALWDGICELGLELSRCMLFLTHLHPDHIGLARSFVDRDVPVYMGRIEHDYLTRMYVNASRNLTEIRFRREGYFEQTASPQQTPAERRMYVPAIDFPVFPVEDGQTLSLGGVTLTAIHTPGHTPGHMVLYAPQEQLLFSGDHILFDISPNVGIWEQRKRSLSDYISSLQKIYALPIRATFPAHRTAGGSVYHRIEELIEHHGSRLNEIYDVICAHPGRTAAEIAASISWNARGLAWTDFPVHQKWVSMSETLAHLDHLLYSGQIHTVDDGRLIRYFP